MNKFALTLVTVLTSIVFVCNEEAADAVPASHDPGSAEMHLQRGNELQSEGDIDGAIGEYREAIRLEPNIAVAHSYLASALRADGNPDKAIMEYRAALPSDLTFLMLITTSACC